MESAALSREEREPVQECHAPLNLGTSSLKTARDGRGNQLASSAPPRTTSRPGRAACPKGLNTSERANLNLPWRSGHASRTRSLDEETERQRRDERSRLSRGLSVDGELPLNPFGVKTAPGVRLGNPCAFPQAG
ncbi:hypothetical protein HPB47_020100 [Ixodes persulcatus]|uniref:Uncharacterized protein n=1 Tax=Ixodes persulcatus TaxID=34615 RepID=A0AC60QIC4_IXOPE|nr:hypothetical protein HPB47_020100 [Ixodes persulcatus]